MSSANDFIIENGVLKKYTGSGGDVVIPDGVTTIGDCAFKECVSLITVTIPDSVTSIGNSAFYACRELKNIAIPESITKIGISAFCQCTKLQTVTLPECLTEIGALCFGGCKCLTDILIPDTVTNIGERAFISCTALETVTLPVGLECIGDKAFFNCNSKLLILCSKKIFGMLNKENKDNLAKLWMTGNAEFQQDQVNAIEKYVSRARNRLFLEIDGDDGEALVKLLDCGKLTPEVIESYLKKCNDGQHPQMMAMLLSYKDKNVSPQVREELIDKELGLAERTAKDWAKIYRWNAEEGGITITKYKGIDEDVDIPDQIDGLPVVKIGKNAFKGNTQLKKVRMPNTVTEIMESAFEKCTSLLNVEWSENLTHIEKRAFYWCSMLSGTLSLPQSVKSLGVAAFAGCDYSKFDLPEGLEYIEERALACGDIKELHIPATVKKMADCIEYSTGDLYIHGMKTKIPVNYFQGCLLQSMLMPEATQLSALKKVHLRRLF